MAATPAKGNSNGGRAQGMSVEGAPCARSSWAVCAWGPAGALRPSTRHWLQTKAARQSSVNRGFDDARRKENQRQCHPYGPLGLALPRGDRLNSLIGIGDQIVEPAMGLANGVDEDDTRAMRHGARDAHFFVRALDDLAPAMGDDAVQGRLKLSASPSSAACTDRAIRIIVLSTVTRSIRARISARRSQVSLRSVEVGDFSSGSSTTKRPPEPGRGSIFVAAPNSSRARAND